MIGAFLRIGGVVTVVVAVAMLSVTLPTFPMQIEISRAASPAVLESHVKTLCGSLAPRHHLNIERLDMTADYIAAQWKQQGLQVSRQPFQRNGKTYQNVIADIGPNEGPLIVVGAHYDVAGDICGADDNASGVAGLLELARLLADVPLNTSLQLVAYSLEEPPYFAAGSEVHADSLRQADTQLKLMISLEMIGYFTDAEHSQQFPTPLLKPFYPHRGNFILVVGRSLRDWKAVTVKQAMQGASNLPVRSIHAPRFIKGVDFSDHRSYWDAGFPALMITDTAFYRNPHYHQPTDMPDTLDYARMAQVIDGVAAAIVALQ